MKEIVKCKFLDISITLNSPKVRLNLAMKLKLSAITCLIETTK